MISIGFEPFVKLAEATASGSQIGDKELEAYEFAVDYYGEERVALQKTKQYVEGTDPYNAVNRSLAVDGIMNRYKQDLTKEDLTFNSVQNNIVKDTRSLYSIFIHWPQVTVTNEDDQSVNIENLFARIPLSTRGLRFQESEKFTFMKTTYSRIQWNHSYVHSHVRATDNPMVFQHVCLGTGPILRTIRTLQDNPDNKEAIMLFFWELDKVAHVESLSGVPYIRLSSLTAYNPTKISDFEHRPYLSAITIHHKPQMRDFLSSFVKAVEIPFGFKDGKYILGCSFADFAIKLTNYYKRWRSALNEASKYGKYPYATEMINLFLTHEYILKNGDIYYVEGEQQNRSVPDSSPFLFNGKEFPLIVEENSKEIDYTKQELINANSVSEVIVFILNSINIATSFRYEQKSKEEDDLRNEQLNAILSCGKSKDEQYAYAAGSTSTIN